MAKRVHEIMNHELFCLVPDDTVRGVRGYFYVMDIAAAPVVDDDGRPVGFASLRDLLGASDSDRVADVMTKGADAIPESALITEAAERMSELGRHHLPVVGQGGRVVGYLGSLDVVCGLIGKPARHPATFPRYDATIGLNWTADFDLREENLPHVPEGPGFLRLVRIRAGEYDHVVWSERLLNVRQRVAELVRGLPRSMPHLVEAHHRGELRFRTATADDAEVGAWADPKPPLPAWKK